MRLHDLKPNPGAKHRRKRLGAGESSGHGKTSGKGHKGQKARSGGTIRPGFEGGQMPLHRRLPKRGFTNIFALDLNEVNLGRIQAAVDKGTLAPGEVVNAESLVNAGVLRRARDGVRLLGGGELNAKLQFEVHGASKSAVAAVEKTGGSVKILGEKAQKDAGESAS